MVFIKYIAVLLNQDDATILEERDYTHCVAALDHAIERLVAVGHFGDILAHPHPRILVDRA
jgi:hypothetical protein